MFNFFLVGRLGQDAVIRNVNGKSVINFSVCHNNRFIDQDGVVHETETWVDCSIWRKEGKTGLAKYLTKGKRVLVGGIPNIGVYQGRDGQHKPSIKLQVREFTWAENPPSNEEEQKPDVSPQKQARTDKPTGEDEIPVSLESSSEGE